MTLIRVVAGPEIGDAVEPFFFLANCQQKLAARVRTVKFLVPANSNNVRKPVFFLQHFEP